MKRNNYFTSLAFQIIFRISLLVILICSVLSFAVMYFYKTSMESQIKLAMEKSYHNAEKTVNLKIQDYVNQVAVLSRTPEIRSMNWSVQQPLLEEEARKMGFEWFEIGDLGGNTISTNGMRNNVSGLPYYKKTLTGKHNISDVTYSTVARKMVINVSSPIYNERGQLIGAISGVTSADEVNAITSAFELDYDGGCFIINAGGYKMAGTDYMGKTTLENDLRNPDAKLGGPLYQMADIEKTMIQGKKGLEEVHYKGKDYYISYVPVNDGAWYLGILQDKKQAMEPMNIMLSRMIALAIVFIIVGIISGTILSKDLHPLRSVSKSIRGIASGNADLTQRIAVTSENEIGDVVQGFNAFTEKLQTIMAVTKQSKNTLVASGADMKSGTQATLDSISTILEKIRLLGNNINDQTSSVEQTAGAVNEISSNIESLKNMIESQVRSVSQASAAVEEMIGNISSVNKSMEKMSDSFKTLEANAVTGLAKQEDVSQKIDIVGQESEMLNEANLAISSIAEQTNLLAMNAAIEAAHAGEAGKGFSVVADEIRKLSETSSEQSKTIGNQLKKIQNSIQDIIIASEESKKSFETVSDGVKATDNLVQEITIAMQEQTEGSKQINEALHTMNDNTSEVQTAVVEMSEGNAAILKEIKNLQEAAFALKDGMSEMEIGANEISKTGGQLESISVQMEDSIKEIGYQVDQFKTE